MVRSVIYGRVSRTDGVSTSAQIESIMERTNSLGEEVVDKVEEYRTAKDKKGVYDPITYMKQRPKFYELFLRAKNHEFDKLWVWKWDRFSRSTFHGILYDMFYDCGVVVEALMDSNDGLARDIQGDISKYELKKITERVKLVRVKDRFEKGWVVAKAPIGYKLAYKIVGKRKIFDKVVLDSKKARMVKDVFGMTIEGKRYKEICTRFKINPKTYYAIIRNKVYMGVITFEGEERVGVHTPIVTKEEFEKANKVTHPTD